MRWFRRGKHRAHEHGLTVSDLVLWLEVEQPWYFADMRLRRVARVGHRR